MNTPATQQRIVTLRNGEALHQRCSVSPESAPRLLIVVTKGKSASLLMKGQLHFLASQGFDVTVVAGSDEHLQTVAAREGVRIVALPMTRSIEPLRDLWMLWHLWRLMRVIKPHIVNASTPKGGLLGMAAAALARVPVRIYTLRGLRLATTAGLRRWVLATAEWWASRLAHRVWCVSHSLADEYVAGGFAPHDKVVVLGNGSSNGVDMQALASNALTVAWRGRFRSAHGISDRMPVIGFVGRLTRDKGIVDLVQAFDALLHRFPDIRLLLIGDFEVNDPIDAETQAYIRRHPRIVCTDFVSDATHYYHAMDLLVFPSYREGFPNAVLEAQAAGLPVVAFDVTGTRDAIVDGETGRLVPVGDVASLTQVVATYLDDVKLRTAHGEQGRRRVAAQFSRAAIWTLIDEEYRSLLAERRIEVPGEPGNEMSRAA